MTHIRLTGTTFITTCIIFLFSPFILAEPEEPLPDIKMADKISDYSRLRESIEAAIITEKERIKQLNEEFLRAQQIEKSMASELNAYKIQISSFGNLLLTPASHIKDIEKAWTSHQVSLERITNQLKDLTHKRDAVKQMLDQTIGQYDLNEKQLLDINIEAYNIVETQSLIDNLQTLIRLLTAKIRQLEKIYQIYKEYVRQLEETRNSLVKLSGEFEQQIKIRQKEELFKRKDNPLFFLTWRQIKEDAGLLLNQIYSLFSKDFWLKQVVTIWNSGIFWLVSSLLLFAVIQAIFFQFHRYSLRIARENLSFARQYPWRNLILQLLQRSVLLMGTTLFLYAYAHIQSLYTIVPLIRMGCYLLIIWLFSCWGTDFLILWNQRERGQIPAQLIFRLRLLLMIIRYFAILYVIISWLVGEASIILIFGRMGFEITLFIWCIRFWEDYHKIINEPRLLHIRYNSWIITAISLSYLITVGGLILEFAGYGSLAIYWYSSWGSSGIVLLWGTLFFFLLFEWNRRFSEAQFEGASKPAEPIKWFFLQISWLAWFGILTVLLLFAWGAKQAVIIGFFRVLNKSIPVGGLDLSILGFVFALMVLLFTYAVTRLWKYTLLEKFLVHSGLQPGLKESITTITIYLFWLFGILMALNVIGISKTSLAVVFGSLGIGLGFGLQNIFNNFISGIILLFERPIQVGDAVEINGIWGEVKKINVRSTLVQTYDNASLIIPNSEFISSQVTNWSFKDPRIRRVITIGVAYGSDTKLVSKTLLEIADSIPEIYKYPLPSVIFSDFGDNALIFKLRIWTHVDNCLTAETAVRFEIDRLFRKKNIQIPFPQRDIHIIPVEK